MLRNHIRESRCVPIAGSRKEGVIFMRISTRARKLFSAAVSAVMAAVLIIPNVPATAATVTVGKTLTTKEGTNAYRGETADLASSGLKTISVYVTVDDVSGSTVNVSYGFGIGLDASPWWIELDHGKFTQTPADPDDTGTSVEIPAGKSTPITVDISKLNVKYETGQYAGEYEFRNYYCGGGTLTVDKIVPNDTAKPDTPSGPSSTAAKSGAWSLTDNKDGTATIKTTLTGTIDDIGATLTAGKDEETYEDENGASTWEEGMPINSRKLLYKDFGVPASTDDTKVTLESFQFSISSKTNLDTFMYGCGLNVEYMSPADTEYWLSVEENPDTRKGYWYNDHGDDEDGNPTVPEGKLEIEVGKGTRLEDCGKWVEAVWDVPADVQPYATTKDTDTVSIQYWYGDNKEDGYTTVDEVTLEAAACTFTDSNHSLR